MRNKLYVGLALIPAVLLVWAAIHFAMGDNMVLALIPAGLAVGMVFIAVRVGKAESFAPAPKESHDRALSANVKRWLKVQKDEASESTTTSASSQVRRQ